jgi:hypothetical protein
MNARAFVDSLESRGATLEVEAGRLRVTPSRTLTDADRAMWKEHRAVYDHAAARDHAHQMYERGEITDVQRDQLLAYAQEPTR